MRLAVEALTCSLSRRKLHRSNCTLYSVGEKSNQQSHQKSHEEEHRQKAIGPDAQSRF